MGREIFDQPKPDGSQKTLIKPQITAVNCNGRLGSQAGLTWFSDFIAQMLSKKLTNHRNQLFSDLVIVQY
jgi:hypothetical protein